MNRSHAVKSRPEVGARLNLRIDEVLGRALDAEVARHRVGRVGATVHRAEVVREILWRALEPGAASRPRARRTA